MRRPWNFLTNETAIPNLTVIETVASMKVADLLEKAANASSREPIRVYLQVNTSGESSKSGLMPITTPSDTTELAELAKHIMTHCPSLRLSGLMTIGSPSEHLTSANPDFVTLITSRDNLIEKLRNDNPMPGPLELSMGMSGDFLAAIEAGSDNVRVGTRIFGERPKLST